MQKLHVLQDAWHDPADKGDVVGAEPALHPFPEGWYFVADRSSIVKQTLIQKQWLGQEIVVWCDDEGAICVARSVCPHLGSSLGPDVGGRVQGGLLVCPFHGFAYNAAGACVATPFAEPPKSTRLNVFETREICGLVFAWWGIDGRPPQWDLPKGPEGGGEWSGMETRAFRFAGHPQETTENSVDLAHLRYVHGYDNVEAVGTATVDGAHLVSCFNFRRRWRIAGLAAVHYDVSAITHVHGLGYSYVDVREHSIGMDTRLWVLATPVDGTLIELVLVSQLRQLRKPRRAIAGLRFLPVGLRTRTMNRIVMSMQEKDVLQDVVIWQQKSYRRRPRLSRSDGPIGKYRRYCRQFYPDALHADRNSDRSLTSAHQSGVIG